MLPFTLVRFTTMGCEDGIVLFLGDGTIPATKPGKRYVLYQDELDKWLEANRKNAVPLTVDEENEVILSSHKRKPNKADWQE